MRPIKFKGRTATGWATTAVGEPGWSSFWAAVDPATVAQYIGVHDINGAEIYEGDIVAYRNHRGQVRWQPGFYEIHWTVRDGDRATLNHHFESWNPAADFTIVGTTRTADTDQTPPNDQ
jgi:uncharacterized phage protein (TIGR01671 family)